MNENLCCYDFLIGNSNAEAAAACFGAVKCTSDSGRVIFVYGKSGCGKTHLLNATYRLFREKFPQHKATAVTIEELVENHMKSIDSCTAERFADAYAENKLLLVDDFGFLVGKVSTQESLAQIFKVMSLSGSTVIVFSEYAPECFSTFDNPICTATYKVVKIGNPDAQLLERFLDKRLEEENISLSASDRKRAAENCGKDFSSINAYVLKLNLNLLLSGSVRNGKAVGLSGVLYDEKL